MKVDLHIHSPLSKKHGDAIKFFSYKHSFNLMYKEKVDVCSWTDHNNFDAKKYLEAKRIATKFNILLLPGVEVDIIRINDVMGQVLVIFDSQLSNVELNQLENVIKNKTGKRKMRVQEIDKIFSEFQNIKVPHVGKDDFLAPEDLKTMTYDAVEITNRNHRNFKKYLKDNEVTKKSIVAFSDTHIWDKYPQNAELYTWIDNVKSFSDLKLKLNSNQDFVKTL